MSEHNGHHGEAVIDDLLSLPIPRGWTRTNIGTVGEVRLGRQRSPKNRSADHPVKYLRAANITWNGLDLTDVLDMEFRPTEMAAYRLEPGDVLLSEASGSPTEVGKPAIWNGELEDCCFQNTVIRFRSKIVDPKFALIVFQHFARNAIFSRVSRGVGIHHLSADRFSSMPFLLPPPNEQRRIVGKIEELFSDLEAGVAALTRAKGNLKRYRASVLKAAVEGSLTADWRAAHVEAASRRLSDDATTTPTLKQQTTTRQDAASTGGDDVGYFDPRRPTANLQGNLPHWRQEHVTYFVTFRLADSIPAATLDLWKRDRDDWLARNPEPHSPAQKREYEQQFVNRFHKWLDAGHGECLLGRPDVRHIVTQALAYFQNSRYLLREWVVMPNHVHVIVTPLPGHELSDILHSWKSFTAKKINKLLGKTGTFWQKESFDHIVRGSEQLDRIERYIHNNPQSLSPDRFALGCIHDVEATSRRLPEAPQFDLADDVDTGASVEQGTRQDAASTIEPASKLLARILTERRRQWEADQLAKFTAANKPPPKNWQAKYTEPAPPDTTDLSDLPDGWCWVSLDSLCSLIADIDHNMPKAVENGVKFLSAKDLIDNGKLNFTDDVKLISEEDYIRLSRKAQPRRNDIIYSRIGARLGKARLVQTDEKFLVSYSCCTIRPLVVSPVYLTQFLDSGFVLARAMANTQSIGVPDLGLDRIKRFAVPLCSLAEQAEIVAAVSEKLSQIESAEVAIEHSLRRAARLRQSILKQAFQGKLVPQDPTDEPASSLLERLSRSINPIEATRSRRRSAKVP